MHRLLSVRKFHTYDERICLRISRAGQTPTLRWPFRAISRLGDGVFWYALMLWLAAVHGAQGMAAALHMLVAGGASLLLYRWLKAKASRPRPDSANASIVCSGVALDQFSFPSGHTLHAAAFTTIALSYFPGYVWLVLPFTFLVALSRLVLGLHYPSDVLAGGVIGLVIATVLLTI